MYKLAYLFLGSERMINTVHIGLSYNCNLKCKHCFVDVKNDKMSISDCLDVIDILLQEGLFVAVYTYGEPLLWPSFFDLVKSVKKRNIIQVLMTNGTLIDDNIAIQLKASGINMVYVSIDSCSEEKHDKNRGMLGTFKKAINAIEQLNKIGIKTGVATTVTLDNCNELEEIYNYFTKYEIQEISFLRERKDGCVTEFETQSYYDFFKKHIDEIGKKIIFHDANLNRIVCEKYNEGIISKEKKDLLLEMNRCKNCNTLCVYPNGDISKCNFSNKLSFNYFTGNFAEYLRSDEFKNENSVCYT